MKLWKGALLCMLMLGAVSLAGCNQEEEKLTPPEEAPTQAQQEETQEESAQAQPSGDGIHVQVGSAEVTEEELAAQDNTVKIPVTLTQNPGITYAEWGIIMDSRCTFEKDEENPDVTMPVYESINDEEHFMWTAWTSGVEESTDTGCMIVLTVKLPGDAKAGDVYEIRYADMSLAELPHVWSSDTHNFGDENAVTWEDGTITVTE